MERRADWPAAEVEATDEGYVLRVPIEGDPDPDWDDAFRRAAEAHRHEVWGGRWGHVRPGLSEIRVEQVSEGSEQALRAFLDRCILEAHERTRQEAADRREDEEALERRRTEASYGYEPTQGRSAASAQRMTAAFRRRIAREGEQ
ncbi:MAG TPA: hypothetical protein VGV57_07850 [Thermoleophilaceae bacterium]|nr:hypothetical protein [Thermoleophilaceae bacterium]